MDILFGKRLSFVDSLGNSGVKQASQIKRFLLVRQVQISWGCNDNITERNEVHLCWGTFIGNLSSLGKASSLGIYLQWEDKLLKRCKINALLN